jgi:hypothetical protein
MNRLELDACPYLNHARIQLRLYGAERRVGDIAIHRPQIDVIEEVEELEAKLERSGFAKER